MKWDLVKLGDVCGILSGFAFKSSEFNKDGKGFPLIKIGDAGRNSFNTFYSGKYDPKFVMQTGDVLVGMSGDFYCCRWTSGEALLNQRVCRMEPQVGKLNKDYLLRYLPILLEELERSTPAFTVKNLSTKDLADAKIPLPPLAEQQRIASRLDAADQLRARRRESLSRLDALTHALFLEMFGAALREPPIALNPQIQNGERWEKLTNVARLVTGHTPSRRHPEYWDGDIPWISLTEIRKLDCKVAYDTSEHATAKGIANSSAVVHPAGTVCFSRTASVGFVTMMGREMSTSQDFVNWICGDEIDPTYLMFALRYSRESLRALSSGSTHKTIYFPTVEEFRVYLPPLSLQLQFAERLAQIEVVRARMDSSRLELDALFASLQSAAFE